MWPQINRRTESGLMKTLIKYLQPSVFRNVVKEMAYLAHICVLALFLVLIV